LPWRERPQLWIAETDVSTIKAVILASREAKLQAAKAPRPPRKLRAIERFDGVFREADGRKRFRVAKGAQIIGVPCGFLNNCIERMPLFLRHRCPFPNDKMPSERRAIPESKNANVNSVAEDDLVCLQKAIKEVEKGLSGLTARKTATEVCDLYEVRGVRERCAVRLWLAEHAPFSQAVKATRDKRASRRSAKVYDPVAVAECLQGRDMVEAAKTYMASRVPPKVRAMVDSLGPGWHKTAEIGKLLTNNGHVFSRAMVSQFLSCARRAGLIERDPSLADAKMTGKKGARWRKIVLPTPTADRQSPDRPSPARVQARYPGHRDKPHPTGRLADSLRKQVLMYCYDHYVLERLSRLNVRTDAVEYFGPALAPKDDKDVHSKAKEWARRFVPPLPLDRESEAAARLAAALGFR
jgi:hypothetical protein